MKIDPCPCVISLNDGSVHTLFEFRHFLEPSEDRPFRERNWKNHFKSDLGGKDHV